MEKDFVFLATGDIGMNRENPSSIFDGVRDTLNKGDLVFGQLEPCLASVGTPACQSRLPMRGDPKGAGAIREAGYDVISFATNHCMDWGREAFFQTIDVLKKEELRVIGAGKDISEARKPAIVEINGTKIGFLGYNTILPQDYYATKDRPGCAPMRGLTVYEPIEHDQPGTPCRIHTFPHRDDLKQLLEDIRMLRKQVDIVALSIHWGIHFIPAVLADYQRDVAHAAIDAGADVILGHHTHILKPIEVYKGKVIFYSLANFALDPPQAFAENLDQQDQHQEMMKLNKDWKNSKKKMPEDSYKTILARMTVRGGAIQKVEYLPVLLDDDSNPHLVKQEDTAFLEIVRYMEEITENQEISTRFTVDGDAVVIETAEQKQ
ncbi:CapA family protein [Cuneatibacter sp. NSJ-177]|uniref:CapA family protein n=1 Tax=Cuneatibacter sp. NSJ-177 TaxID=2931401 RepID=UPI001FCFAEB8|nr:CapA family protein [Cuneatibacter sp. NSJ-177]MCJ7836518.1 CapA family protein [Cuneatibacter sp. NSJ-177]